MKRVLAAVVGMSMAAGLGCTSGDDDDSGSGSSSGATKVGFIYVGPVTDYGWTKSHEDGRNYLETFGDNVQTLYRENATAENAPALIDELVGQGCSIIFTTSLDFLPAAKAASSRHPDLYTLNCTGFEKGHHFGSYMARQEEMEYLAGMVAGNMTVSNKIGVVAGLRVSEQVMHLNAFALGVRSVKPTAQVLVRWMGYWFDPAREVTGANDLIDEGCDVIRGLTDTNIPLSTAAGRGVWTMGHDSKDGCTVSPEKCLVTSFYNWGPLNLKLVNEIRNGSYPSEGRVDYLGIADLDVVGLSDFAPAVPAAVRTAVLAKKDDLVAKRFNVFQGPFKYDDGTAWTTAGQTLTDQDVLCMKRYVEGVTDVDGPACSAPTDCGSNLTCVNGKCHAADLAGCATP